ncbi:MAG: hypothetical protein OXF20_05340 [Gammaproteobacteria bacterium]|nr:hypothetical protein [Gammaproteobacteria bacterium]
MIYDLISSYAVQSVNIGTSGLEVGKPANILTHEWETGLDVFRYHEALRSAISQSKIMDKEKMRVTARKEA